MTQAAATNACELPEDVLRIVVSRLAFNDSRRLLSVSRQLAALAAQRIATSAMCCRSCSLPILFPEDCQPETLAFQLGGTNVVHVRARDVLLRFGSMRLVARGAYDDSLRQSIAHALAARLRCSHDQALRKCHNLIHLPQECRVAIYRHVYDLLGCWMQARAASCPRCGSFFGLELNVRPEGQRALWRGTRARCPCVTFRAYNVLHELLSSATYLAQPSFFVHPVPHHPLAERRLGCKAHLPDQSKAAGAMDTPTELVPLLLYQQGARCRAEGVRLRISAPGALVSTSL